jgi:hypothetical protein
MLGALVGDYIILTDRTTLLTAITLPPHPTQHVEHHCPQICQIETIGSLEYPLHRYKPRLDHIDQSDINRYTNGKNIKFGKTGEYCTQSENALL